MPHPSRAKKTLHYNIIWILQYHLPSIWPILRIFFIKAVPNVSAGKLIKKSIKLIHTTKPAYEQFVFFCRKWFFDLKVVSTFLFRGLNMGHGKVSSKIQGLVNINDYKMSIANYIIYIILNLSLILSSILKHTESTIISIVGSLENGFIKNWPFSNFWYPGMASNGRPLKFENDYFRTYLCTIFAGHPKDSLIRIRFKIETDFRWKWPIYPTDRCWASLIIDEVNTSLKSWFKIDWNRVDAAYLVAICILRFIPNYSDSE